MALKVFTEDVESQAHPSTITVKHSLGTLDIFVQVWQNGYLILPSVERVDENSIKLHGIVGAELQVTILANVVAEQKSNRKDKSSAKRTKTSRS